MRDDVTMREVWINGRWPLLLPEHRAVRPEWPYWEATRLAAMHSVIRPGHLVFDIGAEEGDFPGLWASWGAGVVLFEPNDRVWPNVKAIFEANELGVPRATFSGFAGPVTEYDEAMLVKGGWPQSADGPVIGDHGFCNLWERPDIGRIRVDDMVLQTGLPDVLTMDVEGAELEVLKGAEDTLAAFDVVVFVSIHPDFMRDMYGYGPEELHTFMGDMGYGGEYLATDHEEHWRFSRSRD